MNDSGQVLAVSWPSAKLRTRAPVPDRVLKVENVYRRAPSQRHVPMLLPRILQPLAPQHRQRPAHLRPGGAGHDDVVDEPAARGHEGVGERGGVTGRAAARASGCGGPVGVAQTVQAAVRAGAPRRGVGEVRAAARSTTRTGRRRIPTSRRARRRSAFPGVYIDGRKVQDSPRHPECRIGMRFIILIKTMTCISGAESARPPYSGGGGRFGV